MSGELWLWKHKKTGNLYVIQAISAIKLCGTWYQDSAVTYYQAGRPEETYVRFLHDFQEKFERVERDGSEL